MLRFTDAENVSVTSEQTLGTFDTFAYIMSFISPYEVLRLKVINKHWQTNIECLSSSWKPKYCKHFPQRFAEIEAKGSFPDDWLLAFKQCEREGYRTVQNYFTRAQSDLFAACKDGDMAALIKILPKLYFTDLDLADALNHRSAATYAYQMGYQGLCDLLYKNLVHYKGILTHATSKLEYALLTYQSADTVASIIHDEHADRNGRLRHGLTPLTIACRSGQYATVCRLIAMGVDLNLWFSGETPLIFAIKHGHYEIVDALLVAGADVDITGMYGLSPLSVAIETDQAILMERILLSQPYLPIDKNAIRIAALKGNRQLIERLLELGADINAATPTLFQSALFKMVKQQQFEMVEYLLDKGANPNTVDFHQWSIEFTDKRIPRLVIVAKLNRYIDNLDNIYYPNKNIAKLILDVVNGHATTSILIAFEDVINNDKFLKLILSEAFKKNIIQYPAIDDVSKNICSLTVSSKATLALCIDLESDLVCLYSESVLLQMGIEYAISHGHRTLAEELIAIGADICKAKQRGFELVLLACQHGKPEMIDFLFHHGVDVNGVIIERNNDYRHFPWNKSDNKAVLLPLVIKAFKDCSSNKSTHAAIMRIIEQPGIKLDVVDSEGKTLLYYACKSNFADMAALIIARGADIKVLTNGENLVQTVRVNGAHACLKLLLDAGVVDNTILKGFN